MLLMFVPTFHTLLVQSSGTYLCHKLGEIVVQKSTLALLCVLGGRYHVHDPFLVNPPHFSNHIFYLVYSSPAQSSRVLPHAEVGELHLKALVENVIGKNPS